MKTGNGGRNLVVVGLGELLWDLLPSGRQLGGAPANFAYHAQALGALGIVVSQVGDDEPGHEALALLERHGLTTRYIATTPERPTGTVSVRLDALGKPVYVIHENVAWDYLLCEPDLLDLAVRADAVCFGSLAQRSPVSRASIRRFIEAASASCLRVCDINLRPPFCDADIIRESLAFCNVLKLNDEELPEVAAILAWPDSEEAVLDRLIAEYRLELVALTRGERGSLMRTADETVEHQGAKPDRIVDTVGAGDCFAAATVVGMLRGEPLSGISDRANRAASYVCSQPGAMPAFPREILGGGSCGAVDGC